MHSTFRDPADHDPAPHPATHGWRGHRHARNHSFSIARPPERTLLRGLTGMAQPSSRLVWCARLDVGDGAVRAYTDLDAAAVGVEPAVGPCVDVDDPDCRIDVVTRNKATVGASGSLSSTSVSSISPRIEPAGRDWTTKRCRPPDVVKRAG
ncbi:hypothetical protein CXG46_05070 [Nocardioides alpinus]|uniref:Uncharacterized protein n=1 Tax=Nocardioides alpinus TaxID=748909 RepID=A0ABX4R298_9ACTN|nr:hypothetical protein CXG46_05070 [Nocardioides alpinus]